MKLFFTYGLFLATLLLSTPCVVARGTKEQDAYQERCLSLEQQQQEDDNRFLSDNDLPRCKGGTQESWFNFEARLEKISDKCDEKDAFILGALISDVVRKVECSIPEYKDEYFMGEMCEFPSQQKEEEGRLLAARQQHHRDLGKQIYWYRGGGRCNRCRRRRDRRNLRSFRMLKEVSVDAVCSFAVTATLGANIAQNTMEEANINYESVVDLAGAFYDAEKGAKEVEEAEKNLEECDIHGRFVKSETDRTLEWCERAKSETSKEGLKKCIKEAEKTVKKAMEETKKARQSLHKIRDVKHELMKEDVKHKAEQKEENVKRLISNMKDDLEERIEDLEKEIKSLEKKMKKSRESEKEKYEKQKEVLENDKKRMEDEAKQAMEFLKEEAKMEEKIDLLRVDLSNVDDEDDWLKTFSELLEEEIPKNLMYFYNATTPGGPGCLDVYPEAKVETWAVSEEDETTPLDECVLDFEWK